MSDSRYRDFDAAEAERRGEPLRFRLGGTEFTVDIVSATACLTLARNESASDAGQFVAWIDFIRACVREEQREVFEEALKSLSLIGVRDLQQFLLAGATGAPLAEPSPSVTRRSKVGRRSKVVSLPKDSTPSSSASAAS